MADSIDWDSAPQVSGPREACLVAAAAAAGRQTVRENAGAGTCMSSHCLYERSRDADLSALS